MEGNGDVTPYFLQILIVLFQTGVFDIGIEFGLNIMDHVHKQPGSFFIQFVRYDFFEILDIVLRFDLGIGHHLGGLLDLFTNFNNTFFLVFDFVFTNIPGKTLIGFYFTKLF